MSEEYPRQKRITRRSEFGIISKRGRRVRALDLDVRYLASPLKFLRVGIIVPRHGHSAVDRNLVKRRLRELVRRELIPGIAGVDVVLRCRPSVYGRSYDDLKQQIGGIRTALVEASETRNH